MPAPPRPDPPDNTARVTVFGRYPPVRWSNVFWLDVSTSGTAALAALNNVCADVLAAYETNFGPVLNTNIEILGAQLVFWDSTGERVVDEDTTAIGSDPGTVALPAQVAVGITWSTSAHYRGGHPRTYLPGVNQESCADVTRLNPGDASRYANAADGFRTDVNAIDSTPSITAVALSCMSFVLAGAWRTPPIHRHITGATCDTRLDTQRRRLGPDVPA